VSAHYLLPDPHDPSYRGAGYEELRAFRLVDEDKRAWHAGVSQWGGRDNLNSRSIGIEIVNQAWDDGEVLHFAAYPDEQIEVLIALLRDILERYPRVGPTDILGHSDVAYWRKSDPGPRLPWRRLYEAGIGAWFDEPTQAMYQRRFCGHCHRKLKWSARFSAMDTRRPRIARALNSGPGRFRCTFDRRITVGHWMRRPARFCTR
jgi:N-acetylmuramoyl-L-alanine amidase